MLGIFRKMFGNVRVTLGQVLENFRKSSLSSRRSSENPQKRRHQYVYNNNEKKITCQLIDINFMLLFQEQYLTRSLRSLVLLALEHKISSCRRVISSM